MAKEIVNDKNNTFWPVKYASTDVWYQDVKYRIGTEIIQDIALGETEQWLYEKISYEVSRDMYQLGAQYSFANKRCKPEQKSRLPFSAIYPFVRTSRRFLSD